MARLERVYLGGGSISDCFDLVTGTSTGGIIALGLALGLKAAEVLEIYLKRGGEVFPDYGWLAGKLLGAARLVFNRCDRQRLDDLIDDIVGDGALWESRVRLCIPAAETRHFEPFIFKTPHHPDYQLDWSHSMSLIAKTTSAAPTYFGPVARGDGYEFVDGGTWANNPIMVGIADALACFEVPRERIRVLSLGCVRADVSMTWGRRHLGGMWFWRNIMLESMELLSQSAIGQARLIVGGDHVLRIDAGPLTPPLGLTDWARCREVLPGEAAELVKALGDTPARLFLDGPAERYEPFYTPHRPPA
jgi:patatin-like phospholipase/acyl hydrolase